MQYEEILNRMLSKVSDNVDKREGSIIYDALAPAAAELAIMYIELGIIENESFADTASREYLIRRAKERGLTPKPASYAYWKALAKPDDVNIPIGSRFSIEDLDYELIRKESDGSYTVKCEELGTVGNRFFGAAVPIQYIPKLESFTLTEILIPGEDEEETEKFRQKYFDTFNAKSYGGNIADYKEKTLSISGVGAVKVTPTWNGAGTVLLTILDSEYSKAADGLISKVQEVIDPTKSGEGLGVAPIGHIVTVGTVETVSINVSVKVVTEGNIDVREKIKSAISDYLLSLRKTWSENDTQYVRIAQIDSAIMNIEGVLDVSETTINGADSNFKLEKYQIPVMGEVTIT